MLVDVDSPHKLITVYNPESRVTPHSLLAWLAQCEDAFKIFNSRNADKPLAIADQIRILGHAMQEPSMQQWWMQGREKYLEMTIDDWIGAIKERWLSTSGVNDATRICYGLKQGHKDFNVYATELAYHRISSETSSSRKSHTRTSSSLVHTPCSCMTCSRSPNSTHALQSSPAANSRASCPLGGTPLSAQAGTIPRLHRSVNLLRTGPPSPSKRLSVQPSGGALGYGSLCGLLPCGFYLVVGLEGQVVVATV
ncbi:hypothetical protein B0H14DRAFT_329474 [Mycena olivaceomarginata]|nr:hypothetical protein B0H14DRAFT_329474 [Mycena olivaceomarginata]